MKIQDEIVQIANGLVKRNLTEIQPNLGWTDKDFQNQMQQIGWVRGDEWCADSCILVWKTAYANVHPEIWAIARKMLSANSQLIAKNFHSDPIWPTSTKLPKLGAICIWQDGNSLTTGHAGIVIAINADGSFVTAEGNTSSTQFPDIRTGWTYATHTHLVDAPHSLTGLNFLRFIYCIESYSPLVY